MWALGRKWRLLQPSEGRGWSGEVQVHIAIVCQTQGFRDEQGIARALVGLLAS